MARKLSAIRGYLKFLTRQRRLSENPAHGLSIGRIETKLPRVLSRYDADNLMTAVSRPGTPDYLVLRDNSICELLYGSGLRVSEVAKLDLDDLDLEGASVTVMGKGSKERIVPMNKSCVAAIKRYLLSGRGPMIAALGSKFGGSSSAVFYNQAGLRIGTRDIRRVLDATLSEIVPVGSLFGDAISAIGIAARAATIRFGPKPLWSQVSAMCGGRLLFNTNSPFPAPS